MSSPKYPKTTRYTRDEALVLLRTAPLLELGRAAFESKRERFGDRVTFVSNRHVNPTNLCVNACRFCEFSATENQEHAYSLTEAQILHDLESPAITEAHITGGLSATWGFARSLALVRRIREVRPDLWIKAFTAVEVAYFAREENKAHASILAEMKDAGVDLMPGGGAEVLDERVHRTLCGSKAGPAEWLAIHEQAHQLGLPSNCTLLFGHIESDREIIDHLMQLRDLQDRAPGFQSFVPLAYQPGQTRLVPHAVSAPQCLRVVAIARLVLDNVPHMKAYWPSLHVETAVAALSFGADDLDGTLGKERIMQLAGAKSPERMSCEFMTRMICQAGQLPVERDGSFRPVAQTVAAGLTGV